ncbi:MAG: hypothetical protein WCC60_16715 [Ilumatobacteraceae bacterium]
MTTGFDHVYVETHDWAAALAFWHALGFELQYDTGHRSGALRHPDGGTTVFLAEQSLEDPLAVELYLGATPDEPLPDVYVVSPYVESHWGTKVAIVQDPDGHRFRIQAPTA